MHFDILFVMRWWIAIGCVLCGCSNSGALEIVVEMEPAIAVDRVQLYVGLGDPQNELDDQGQHRRELLVPAGYRYPDRPNGFYWKRDINGASDVLDVESGATDARFTFHEGTHDKLTIIVVGFKGGEVAAAASLVGAKLEGGAVRQYHVKLKAASSPDVKPRAAVTVQRWGPTPEDTRCAYLEDASTEERGIYVVDRSDRDCDGFADDEATECRPDVFHGHIRPKPEVTTCIRMDAIPSQNNPQPTACVLGGPGCFDGADATLTGCEPSNVCVPPAHCAACSARPDAIDCMARLPQVAGLATRIECTFFVNAAGALCVGAATLTPRFPLPIACDPLQPYLLWADGGGWKPGAFAKSGATFTAAMPTAGCDVSVSATNASATPVQGTFPTVLVYPLVNGRSGALPLLIHVKPIVGNGCDDPINTNACLVEGEAISAPSFAECLKSAAIEPW